MANKSELFSPTVLGDISIANRIVMAPMTRARAHADGVHTGLAVDYYGQRATAGLLITESTNISQQGKGYAFTPGVFTESQIASWKRVTKAVHEAGGRILLQLWHAGRFSHTSFQKDGGDPVAPSAIQAGGEIFIETGFVRPSKPRALAIDEIYQVINDFRAAAKNAKMAGFDGVEIHAANSYLLDQFIRDSTNQRTDRYGGSIENRVRLTIEVAHAVSEVYGAGRVGVRLSPTTTAVGDTPFDSNPQASYGFLAERLGELKLAYLHCIEGQTRGDNGAASFDFQILRKKFGGNYIANNGYDYHLATRAIEERRADLISFGRLFISNPDLVERFRTGARLAEASRESFYGNGASGYTDWKTLEHSEVG